MKPSSATALLKNLNPPQQEAVLHELGPLLILAGAGSGKTRTMAHRIAYLISERGYGPSEILGLSFTNKAANELKERVSHLTKSGSRKTDLRGLTVSTFHSLCAKILRTDAHRLGYRQNFTILDQSEQLEILRRILKRIHIDDRRFDPKALLFQFSQAKAHCTDFETAEAWLLNGAGFRNFKNASDYSIAAASSFRHYIDHLKLQNSLDFDDLIFFCVKLLRDFEEVRTRYNKQFRQILVDEYQDTNAAQFEIIQLLTKQSQNLTVVGDDDQSIYGWRGADPTHILHFTQHFPKARVLTLDQNYRSTTTVLSAANAVIEKNSKRHKKNLWSDRGEGELITQILVEDDTEEAETVGEEILKLTTQNEPKINYGDIAVLYRSNTQSRLFEEALRMRKIPYKILGGMSYLDRKEVKDVLAYFRWIYNPHDDASARRILNWPARGLGKTSLEQLSELSLKEQKPVIDCLAHHPTDKAKLIGTALRENILAQKAALDSLVSPEPHHMSEWAMGFLSALGAKAAVEKDSDDAIEAQRRWETIDDLIHSFGQMKGQFKTGTEFLGEYLQLLTLQALEEKEDQEEKDKDTSQNQVILLTLHSAKGLEFPVVFLVGMEDGLLPHKRVIEEATDLSEERRLCYVGITRAKDLLFLTRTKNRIRYGKPVPTNPSRFLSDIPADLMQTRDQSHSPTLSSPESVAQHELKVKNFLDQIRARMAGSGTP